MRINFELLHLRIFLAVIDDGSFHKAAKLLNMSQPALSRRVRTLEERVGNLLFERTTRSVSLTIAGRKLEPIARRLLDELDASLPLIGDEGEQQSGQVTISSIPSAAAHFLPQVAKKFNHRYPLFRLRVLDRTPEEVLDCVVHGEVEFGINLVGATETDIIFTPLFEDPYVLTCHREHPLALQKRLVWTDLEGHELVRVGRPQIGNRAVLDNALTRANVQLNWHFEVNNLTTALALVEAGLGASVLPHLATRHSPTGIVVTRPIDAPMVTRTVGIVERRTSRLSPAASYFRELLLSDWNTGER